MEFNRAYPDIRVNLMADDYLSDLVEQRIDVAVRVTVKGRDSNLVGRKLDAGILVPVMPDVSSTVYSIQLVYPSRKLPLRTRAFVEFLVDSGW